LYVSGIGNSPEITIIKVHTPAISNLFDHSFNVSWIVFVILSVGVSVVDEIVSDTEPRNIDTRKEPIMNAKTPVIITLIFSKVGFSFFSPVGHLLDSRRSCVHYKHPLKYRVSENPQEIKPKLITWSVFDPTPSIFPDVVSYLLMKKHQNASPMHPPCYLTCSQEDASLGVFSFYDNVLREGMHYQFIKFIKKNIYVIKKIIMEDSSLEKNMIMFYIFLGLSSSFSISEFYVCKSLNGGQSITIDYPRIFDSFVFADNETFAVVATNDYPCKKYKYCLTGG
jgi:hypothetical protein